jgi:hypothetical protein
MQFADLRVAEQCYPILSLHLDRAREASESFDRKYLSVDIRVVPCSVSGTNWHTHHSR